MYITHTIYYYITTFLDIRITHTKYYYITTFLDIRITHITIYYFIDQNPYHFHPSRGPQEHLPTQVKGRRSHSMH